MPSFTIILYLKSPQIPTSKVSFIILLGCHCWEGQKTCKCWKPSLEHSRPNPEKSVIPPYHNNTTEAPVLLSQNQKLKKNVLWQKFHLKMSVLQKPWKDINNFPFPETLKHRMTLHLLAQQTEKNKKHYIWQALLIMKMFLNVSSSCVPITA